MAEKNKVCTGCGEHQEESFAMELLRGYKRQFFVATTILSVIILLLIGYIVYDKWQDSLYETVTYSNGDGYYNVIGENNTGNYGTNFKDEVTQGQ